MTRLIAAGIALHLVAGIAAAQPPRPLGSTPVPTAKDLAIQNQFIEAVVDPQYTLDLIVGRPRLIILKAVPTRTQIADKAIADFRLLDPNGKQMTVMGSQVGITVLNLWFVDPDDKAKKKEMVLSYLVRALPDPEEKARKAAAYAALAGEVNGAFPNSRVRLTPVGDKVILSGQAHDVRETGQILRVVR